MMAGEVETPPDVEEEDAVEDEPQEPQDEILNEDERPPGGGQPWSRAFPQLQDSTA